MIPIIARIVGYGDPAVYMLNAVYGQVPALHPGVLGTSDNEGADALKQAVGGSLGLACGVGASRILRLTYRIAIDLWGPRVSIAIR